MKKITYILTSRDAYPTDVDTTLSKTLEFTFDGEEATHLKIGEKIFKISHGVCLVEADGLREGVYSPSVITEGGAIVLDTLTVKGGYIALTPGALEYSKICDSLYRARLRIRELEEDVRRILDAVFGRKLF